MMAKIYTQQSISAISDIECDICKASTKGYHGGYEYAKLRARWGFDSAKDGQWHKCYMCEACYDKVVKFIKSLGGTIHIN